MGLFTNQVLFSTSCDKKAMIFLNTDMGTRLFEYLWSTTSIHITADGAANRLYSMFPEKRERYIPDYIMGDFDSANGTVISYYESRGTTILKDPNQDNTDLDKCLLHLSEISHDLHVIIYGDLGGRFDHSFGIVNSMMIAKNYFTELVLVGMKGTLRILPEGSNTVERCSGKKHKDGYTCGIIPLGGWLCENVSTTGLKWNLDNSAMQFGGMISTSNCMVNDCVTIVAPCPLIWTLEVCWELE